MMLEYKGYIAKIDFDDSDEYIHGEVVNIRDVITFKGKNVEELKQELKKSINTYIAFCQKKSKEPERPFSGKFIIRVAPALHRELFLAAKTKGVSLNKLVAISLENSVKSSNLKRPEF